MLIHSFVVQGMGMGCTPGGMGCAPTATPTGTSIDLILRRLACELGCQGCMGPARMRQLSVRCYRRIERDDLEHAVFMINTSNLFSPMQTQTLHHIFFKDHC